MATIGALVAELSADSASFERDLGKAQRVLKSSSTRMNRSLAVIDKGVTRVTRGFGRMAKNALSLRSVVGVLAGSAGLGLLAKRSIDTADNIAKVADKIGLSTDALQELRFAADLAGVQQNVLDLAMQRFSRRVGEAAQGQGELKDTLKQYGIQVRDTEGRQRRLEDVLSDYAEVVKNAESDQERLRLAFKAFDSEGAALVNVVGKGSAGLEAMRKKARDLGLVLDEKLIRGAAGAKDQLTILGRVVGTNFTAAILKAAPAIGDLATRLSDGLPALIGWVENFGQFTGLLEKPIATQLAEVEARIAKINAEISNAPDELLIGDFAIGIDSMQSLRDQLSKALADRDRLRALLKKSAEAVPPNPAPSAGEPDLGGVPIPRRKPLGEGASFLQRELDAARARQDALAEAVEADIANARRRAREIALAVETPIEAYEREIAGLVSVRKALAETGQASLLSEEQFQRAADAAQARLDEQSAVLKVNNDLARDLGLTFTSAFEDAAVSGARFSDILKGLERDLIRFTVRKAVLNAIGGNSFGGLIASLFGGGGVASGGGGGAGFFGEGGGVSAGGFAQGGSFKVRGSGGTDSQAVQFRATPGERVTVQTPAQQRGGGVTVNVINNAGAQVGVQERQESGGGVSIEVAIDRAVAGALGRRGSETGEVLRNIFGARRALTRS